MTIVSLLEHVPGVWESDSKQAPDVLEFRDDRVLLRRVLHERQAKLPHPDGVSWERVPPVRTSELRHWARTVCRRVEELKTHLGYLPVIVHFVEDRDGVWHFLNTRSSPAVQSPQLLNERPHPVSTLEALRTWDGLRPILLRLATSRGYEELLRMLADRLPKDEGRVFIKFGALSHPAIALREMGLRPIPAYLRHKEAVLMEKDL